MCLQCLPFFKKSRDSPPSSPRHGSSHKPSPRPAEKPPSLEQPLLTSSADPSYETASSADPSYGTASSFPGSYSSSQHALSVEPSYGTPQSAFSVEPHSTTSQEPFQTAQALAGTEAVSMEPLFTPIADPSQESYAEPPPSTTPQEPLQTAHALADTDAAPVEPFLTPVADPSQEYHAESPPKSKEEVDEYYPESLAKSKEEIDESYAEVPTESTSVKEPESAAPEVSPVEVPLPVQGFEFPEGPQGFPSTPAPIGDSPVSDVPEPTSLETSQSAPNLEVKQTDENDPQFVPSTNSVIANLESSQSEPALDEFALPGFSDALSPLEDHHRRHHHFRQHFQGLLKEGGQALKEGKQVLREEGSRHFQEGSRHFQNLFSNSKN